MTDLPLEGVRVLELANLIPGPYATMLLGDLGAEVVKIEKPEAGDYQRNYGPEVNGVNYRFANLNRNKRSVGLDLKSDRGREVFYDLVSTSDALLEGFRPGVVDRLGIGYDDLKEHNPSLVYCSLSGYGQDGPYRDWPSHDVNYMAIGGLVDLTGHPDGPPAQPGYPVADYAGAVLAAFGMLAALRRAERTGEGEYIDASMTDVVASWGSFLRPFALEGTPPSRGDTLGSSGHPCYGIYECADGRYLSVGAMERKFWAALCESLSLEEYVDDHLTDDSDRRQEVFEALESRFRERTRDEWLDDLDPSRVPIASVNDLHEVFESDPHLQARGLLTELEQSGERLDVADFPLSFGRQVDTVRSAAPEYGDDSVELLRELEYTDDVIEELRAARVIDED
jgi:crotonobetainyl-CoA:carnitine CoA-transferase CaiB-like acyl-CoA transferase